MKKESSFIIFLIFCQTIKPLTFTGLIETAGITKNNFLCPTTTSSSISCTNNASATCNLHDDQIIQLFNDPAFWLHQEATATQYDQTVLAYSQDEIQEKLAAQGWNGMGGYCIIISTSSLLGKIIQPKIQPTKNQKKIIGTALVQWQKFITTLVPRCKIS